MDSTYSYLVQLLYDPQGVVNGHPLTSKGLSIEAPGPGVLVYVYSILQGHESCPMFKASRVRTGGSRWCVVFWDVTACLSGEPCDLQVGRVWRSMPARPNGGARQID